MPSTRTGGRLIPALAMALTIGAASCASLAHQPAARIPSADVQENDRSAATTDDEASAASAMLQEQSRQRSFLLPPLEIIAVDGLVNLAGRQLYDRATFNVSLRSIRRNLRGPWVTDDDPFQINQFLHPYQGATYHGIARSSGLNYWQSFAYTFAGSALWEIAGETTPPSRNDQIASGIAGTFLGEPLFRVSHLLLDRRDRRPGAWRTLLATVVSPPVGINHAIFGDRFDSAMRDVVPAADIRVQLGVNAMLAGRPRVSALKFTQELAGFSVEYGFPGKAEYVHAQPFDYFLIDATASVPTGLETLASRGLLAGKDYQAGEAGRGVWGLYGSYDYLAPDLFRLSTTALSVGTTVQSWLSTSMTLHSTALLGVGYAAAQTVHATTAHDYHYGIAPQALLGLRLIAGSRASLDLTTRGYFVSDVATVSTSQHDLILRGDAALALRLYRHHAIGVRYSSSRRHASYPDLPPLTQTRGTVGVFYTYLGSRGFGAIR